jgi:hypothetical protein
MTGTRAEAFFNSTALNFFAAADCPATLDIRAFEFGFVTIRISARRGNRRNENRIFAIVKPGFAFSRYAPFIVAVIFYAARAYTR